MRCVWLPILALILYPISVHASGPRNVLVIINENSAASREIGEYYAEKRKIPAGNVFRIKCPTGETVTVDDYRSQIEKPVKDYLNRIDRDKRIDYLVLTKGIPLRVTGWNRSVDSMLMGMHLGLNVQDLDRGVPNPYYDKRERFSRKKYDFYLATRLDGYTVNDAKALVDRSLAATGERGVFLFDSTPTRNVEGYREVNMRIGQAHANMIRRGFISVHNDTTEFVGGMTGLMGYFSWGSNHSNFDLKKYRSNKFLPGSISETPVSTSGRTFNRTDEGQSLIACLIESGVTGVKGYVSEPFLHAIADPRVLFDRYTIGYNLAESFYMASRWMLWKDIVIGDPLCAPFGR